MLILERQIWNDTQNDTSVRQGDKEEKALPHHCNDLDLILRYAASGMAGCPNKYCS